MNDGWAEVMESLILAANESDQPAVKRTDVGEAAITMSKANRRAAKPTSHDGSVASYCYVPQFSSMIQHVTPPVRAAMKTTVDKMKSHNSH